MYGERPYIWHVWGVSGILKEFGFDETEQVAGLLHDTLEDSDATERALSRIFGRSVSQRVVAVTTPHSLGNRKARLEALISQLEAYPAALPLKLADRLSHARAGGMLKMYRKEHSRFREGLFPLSQDPRVLRMWEEIDALLGVTS